MDPQKYAKLGRVRKNWRHGGCRNDFLEKGLVELW